MYNVEILKSQKGRKETKSQGIFTEESVKEKKTE